MPPKKRPSFSPSHGDASPGTGWVYRSGHPAEPPPTATRHPPHATVSKPPHAPATNAPVSAARHEQAIEIVRRFSVYSGAAGFFPLPVVDLALLGVSQVRMVKQLAAHYDVPFEKARVKAYLGGLVGSLSATGLARGAGGSLIKAIPVVGEIAGAIAMPAFAFGVTFALGRVFVSHFESGGTLLDFNADTARAYFRRHLEAPSGA